MNKTTTVVYISGGVRVTGVLAGHLSPSEAQRELLSKGVGCARVLKTTYNARNLVRIRF
jgi:hypothetical protein